MATTRKALREIRNPGDGEQEKNMFLTILAILGGIALAGALVYQILFMLRYRGMHYNWFSFKREGQEVGLEKDEIVLLRNLAFDNRLSNLHSIYTSQRTLDRCVMKSVERLKNSNLKQQEKDKQIEDVFLLRNKLDNVFIAKKKQVESTRKLKTGQPVTINFEKIGDYNTQVLDNTEKFLTVEMPLDSLDMQEFSWKGKKATVKFSVNNDAEYSFTSKVADQSASAATGVIYLHHCDKLTRQQKRVFKRNQSSIPVNIYTLAISNAGGKRKIKMANSTPFSGVINNISAGGVAIQVGGILRDNTLVKLDFSLDYTNTDIAIGRVLTHSNKTGSPDKILHIKFERINKNTRNRIFEYIYAGEAKETDYAPKTIQPGAEGTTVDGAEVSEDYSDG